MVMVVEAMEALSPPLAAALVIKYIWKG